MAKKVSSIKEKKPSMTPIYDEVKRDLNIDPVDLHGYVEKSEQKLLDDLEPHDTI